MSHHVVQPGETLASICVRYGKTPSAIRELVAHNPALGARPAPRAGLASPADAISWRVPVGKLLRLPPSFLGATPASLLQGIANDAIGRLSDGQRASTSSTFVANNLVSFLTEYERALGKPASWDTVADQATHFLLTLADRYRLSDHPVIAWTTMNWAIPPAGWAWLENNVAHLDGAALQSTIIEPAIAKLGRPFHTSGAWMNQGFGSYQGTAAESQMRLAGWGSPFDLISWPIIEQINGEAAGIPFDRVDWSRAGTTTDSFAQVLKEAYNQEAAAQGIAPIFDLTAAPAGPSGADIAGAAIFLAVLPTLTFQQQATLKASVASLVSSLGLTTAQARNRAQAESYQSQNKADAASVLAIVNAPSLSPEHRLQLLTSAGVSVGQGLSFDAAYAVLLPIAQQDAAQDGVVVTPPSSSLPFPTTSPGPSLTVTFLPGSPANPPLTARFLPPFTAIGPSGPPSPTLLTPAQRGFVPGAGFHPFLPISANQAPPASPTGQANPASGSPAGASDQALQDQAAAQHARAVAQAQAAQAAQAQAAQATSDGTASGGTATSGTVTGAATSKAPLIVGGVIAATAITLFYLAHSGHAAAAGAAHRAAASRPAPRARARRR